MAYQRRSQGYVVPEAYTHGSSEQRSRWYKKGFEAGDLSEFNTFDYKTYPTVDSL
ncbi:MAG: neutral zinc metallopeptidase [Peptoniphilaceae bacterium]|nr:neutral zinc metallopeptidase [Peptoniphilaceae bacterium]MDY6085641.1 neutral zinc metallopeptidase [Peptoniphilaceae bacterium]